MKLPRLLASGLGTLLLASQCAAVTQPNLFNNIAGYWPFDETNGGVAHEASGHGLNGTLVNYPANQGSWVAGQMGGALEFGGLTARQYVHVPDFTKPTTSLTLSAWVYADSLAQWATVARNWNGLYGTMGYGMFSSNPRFSFYFAEPNPQGINVANGSEQLWTPALSLGQWHHIAVVVNGAAASVSFWRDGQNTGGYYFSGSFYPAPVPQLNIGGDPLFTNPSQGFWDGKIDDLAVWTRALDTQEIGAIYNAGLSGQSLLLLVPEPTSASLIVLGCLPLILRRRLKPISC
jgi:hypothetical protein